MRLFCRRPATSSCKEDVCKFAPQLAVLADICAPEACSRAVSELCLTRRTSGAVPSRTIEPTSASQCSGQEMKSTHECDARNLSGVHQSVDQQCKDSCTHFTGLSAEQMQNALRKMEKRLHEAELEGRKIADDKQRSNAALVAVQRELEETKRQLAFMEQRCKLLQDMDSRVSRCVLRFIIEGAKSQQYRVLELQPVCNFIGMLTYRVLLRHGAC